MIATAVMSGTLTIIGHQRHPELRSWAAGLFMQVVGYALLSLQGKAHALLSIVLPNAAITLSLALYATSICKFQGRPVPKGAVSVPVLATLFGFSLLTDSYQGRVIISALIWFPQCALLLKLLRNPSERHRGRGEAILITATVLFMVTLVYRVVAAAGGMDSATSGSTLTPVSFVTYLSSLVNTLLLATGVLAMSLERAEHRSEESARRYRKLFDSASEGIMVLSDGRIRLANPKICDLMGIPLKELIDQAFLEFIHPEDREKALAVHRQRLLGQAEGFRYQIRCLSRSLGTRWIEVSGVAIDWHGSPATLGFVNDVTEQREAAETIRDMAFHDALTGLPNRRMLIDHLRLAMASNNRTGRHGALVFMDLDNFKPLNDQHGHAAGDQFLVGLAHRLQGALRRTDTAARFGGDEFVVLLTDLSTDRQTARTLARQMAEKLQDLVAQPLVLNSGSGGESHTVTHACSSSAGVVLFGGNEALVDELLDQADALMYRSKQAGRARITVEGRD